MTKERRTGLPLPPWALGFGHLLVIGAWSLRLPPHPGLRGVPLRHRRKKTNVGVAWGLGNWGSRNGMRNGMLRVGACRGRWAQGCRVTAECRAEDVVSYASPGLGSKDRGTKNRRRREFRAKGSPRTGYSSGGRADDRAGSNPVERIRRRHFRSAGRARNARSRTTSDGPSRPTADYRPPAAAGAERPAGADRLVPGSGSGSGSVSVSVSVSVSRARVLEHWRSPTHSADARRWRNASRLSDRSCSRPRVSASRLPAARVPHPRPGPRPDRFARPAVRALAGGACHATYGSPHQPLPQ